MGVVQTSQIFLRRCSKMCSSPQYQKLPGFQELCKATGQDVLLESSPVQTSLELLVERPHEPQTTVPESRGWFNASQPEVRRAIHTLQRLGLSRDDLYDTAFDISPDRPLYEGTKLEVEPVKPSRSGLSHQTASAVKHSFVEKKRRFRHMEWQTTLHRMCPEKAHELVTSDPSYLGIDEDSTDDGGHTAASKKGNKTSSKKPGKDESFCATTYSLAICGIVLQSEHEGRKAAESRVAYLERQLRKRKFEDDDSASTSSRSFARGSFPPTSRLPLSPSPTPTCSSSSWCH